MAGAVDAPEVDGVGWNAVRESRPQLIDQSEARRRIRPPAFGRSAAFVVRVGVEVVPGEHGHPRDLLLNENLGEHVGPVVAPLGQLLTSHGRIPLADPVDQVRERRRAFGGAHQSVREPLIVVVVRRGERFEIQQRFEVANRDGVGVEVNPTLVEQQPDREDVSPLADLIARQEPLTHRVGHVGGNRGVQLHIPTGMQVRELTNNIVHPLGWSSEPDEMCNLWNHVAPAIFEITILKHPGGRGSPFRRVRHN